MRAHIVAIVVPILLAVAATACAGEKGGSDEAELTTEEQMDDAQARGYEAAAGDETEKAANWFEKAADCADRIASWEGLMDASLALSSIGDVDASKATLDRANALSAKFNDWRTSLAVGHAYASLPDEAEADDEAEAAINEAKALAEDLESWRAMVEVGTAYLSLKLDEAKSYATDAYGAALEIAAAAEDVEGLETLAMSFDEIGEEAKAAEAREIIKQLPEEKRRKKRDRPPPPPGWSATGRSLAEPREISDESKAILAERAARKHAEATAMALKRGDVDDQTYYIYEYDRYWASHPNLFLHRRWDLDAAFNIGAWADHYLAQYRLVNGVYVRISSD